LACCGARPEGTSGLTTPSSASVVNTLSDYDAHWNESVTYHGFSTRVFFFFEMHGLKTGDTRQSAAFIRGSGHRALLQGLSVALPARSPPAASQPDCSALPAPSRRAGPA